MLGTVAANNPISCLGNGDNFSLTATKIAVRSISASKIKFLVFKNFIYLRELMENATAAEDQDKLCVCKLATVWLTATTRRFILGPIHPSSRTHHLLRQLWFTEVWERFQRTLEPAVSEMKKAKPTTASNSRPLTPAPRIPPHVDHLLKKHRFLTISSDSVLFRFFEAVCAWVRVDSENNVSARFK